ncbi:MAG: hypothetical protein R3283_01075 [Balneolaceae bacterium]|nr:hypothetical protein [Balneolaceae bacterium]
MNKRSSHSINILETPFSTVTSAGHWFHATRDTVEKFVPGLLKKYDYDTLVTKAVAWIDSADSIALILYFFLAYTVDVWVAAVLALLFHYVWYQKKSGFVSIVMTPLLSFINRDLVQIAVAAVALSFMGIYAMYTELIIGIICFFLFKVGLLRRLWDKIDRNRIQKNKGLPLNDRVFKMILIRYALYEDMPPPEAERLQRHVEQAVIDFNTRKK